MLSTKYYVYELIWNIPFELNDEWPFVGGLLSVWPFVRIPNRPPPAD